jgi:hypothetical protein
MSDCFACGREMLEADGCDDDRVITIDGTEHEPIAYGDGYHFTNTEFEAEGRCHDCGAKPGENHHPGCDMEECPNCGGQYFVCDCHTEEKAEIWGDSDE